jgi:hypothetical protein
VSVPSKYLLSAALGLGLTGALVAAPEPARLGVAAGQAVRPSDASNNQKVADTIAELLRASAHLQGYKIDISYQSGIAELSGAVTNQGQKDEAIRIAQGVPGVERVRDRLNLNAPMPVKQVQAAMPPGIGPMPPANGPVQMPGPGMPPIPPNVPVTPFGYPAEPVPIMQAGFSSPYALNTPAMPPYAWPTYAPYNNYSRVAYPTAYPYQAWPFIGPPYPFPKVPLGWRRVQLEWQDGHWWFGKLATCYDWWRIRYW